AEIAFDLGDWEETERHLPAPERRFAGGDLLHVELRRAELALGRGDHAGAQASLSRAADAVGESTEPQFLGPLGSMLAELRRREGDLDGARRAVTAALDRLEYCTEDVMQLARVAA